MAKVTEWLQENVTFIMPIVAQADDQSPLVPSLTSLVDLEDKPLPHFYLVHALTGKSTAYPEPLDDIYAVSPELVITWANKAKLVLDIEDAE